jgi:hypothetical protein
MVDVQLENKKPSPELISLIVRAGELVERYEHVAYEAKDLVKKIKVKAKLEGFGSFEISLLAREVLKDKFSPAQLAYWFPIKKNNVLEENEGDKNDVKKDIEQSDKWLGERAGGSGAMIAEGNPVIDSKDFYAKQEADKAEAEYKKEMDKTNFPEPEQDITKIFSWKVNIENIELAVKSVASEFPKLKNRGWKLVKITIEAL